MVTKGAGTIQGKRAVQNAKGELELNGKHGSMHFLKHEKKDITPNEKLNNGRKRTQDEAHTVQM